MTREQAARRGRRKDKADPSIVVPADEETWIIKLLESAVVAFNQLPPPVLDCEEFRKSISAAQAIVDARAAKRTKPEV